jgi:hypothetical protein
MAHRPEKLSTPEAHRAEDWYNIVTFLLEKLEDRDIAGLLLILGSYYKNLYAFATDCEPSELLKEAIKKSYGGRLDDYAVDAARRMKSQSLIAEQEVARAINHILRQIAQLTKDSESLENLDAQKVELGRLIALTPAIAQNGPQSKTIVEHVVIVGKALYANYDALKKDN